MEDGKRSHSSKSESRPGSKLTQLRTSQSTIHVLQVAKAPGIGNLSRQGKSVASLGQPFKAVTLKRVPLLAGERTQQLAKLLDISHVLAAPVPPQPSQDIYKATVERLLTERNSRPKTRQITRHLSPPPVKTNTDGNLPEQEHSKPKVALQDGGIEEVGSAGSDLEEQDPPMSSPTKLRAVSMHALVEDTLVSNIQKLPKIRKLLYECNRQCNQFSQFYQEARTTLDYPLHSKKQSSRIIEALGLKPHFDESPGKRKRIDHGVYFDIECGGDKAGGARDILELKVNSS